MARYGQIYIKRQNRSVSSATPLFNIIVAQIRAGRNGQNLWIDSVDPSPSMGITILSSIKSEINETTILRFSSPSTKFNQIIRLTKCVWCHAN